MGGLDIKAYRDSTQRRTSTQKDGMLTVLSGYDRLVTDSKERAKEGGEATTTRRPLGEPPSPSPGETSRLSPTPRGQQPTPSTSRAPAGYSPSSPPSHPVLPHIYSNQLPQA